MQNPNNWPFNPEMTTRVLTKMRAANQLSESQFNASARISETGLSKPTKTSLIQTTSPSNLMPTSNPIKPNLSSSESKIEAEKWTLVYAKWPRVLCGLQGENF